MKKAFAVWTNSDRTEGRGEQIVVAICESIITAHRLGEGKYVQGYNCPIEEIELLKVNGRYYGPINLIRPSEEDLEKQKILTTQEAAIKKAKDAGLTDKDIAALKNL